MKKLRYALLVTVIAIFSICTIGLVKAENEKTTISISPLTFDLAADPGNTLNNEMLIKNGGTSPIKVSMNAQDFVATGEEGEVSLVDDNNTYSLASWVKMDSSEFTLNGGEQKAVKFEIVIPKNAEPGGHYGSVYAYLSPVTGTASGAGVGQKVGSLVFLKVNGASSQSAQVKSFKTDKGSYAKGPINFDIRLENTGTVHIKPKGAITVKSMWGNQATNINLEQKNILPGAIRHLTATWDKTPSMGKYTATMLMTYGTGNSQLTATTTFWVINWILIIIWAIIILIILLVIWFGRHRIKNAAKALFKKS